MSRRSKGEGTEWRDKTTGHWRWRIRSQKQEYYVHDPNRERAREKRDQLIAQLRKNIRIHDARQSLTDLLSYWLEEDVRRSRKESTYFDIRKRCELYIVPSIGHYALADIDARLIRRWANATRDNYALSSARQALSILRRALQLAFDEKLIDYNPAASIVIPPAQRDTDDTDEEGQRALSPEQEALVLADVRRHDAHQTTHADKRFNQSAGMYLLYSLAFGLGLRRGELLGLRRQDIKLDQRTLYVRQQVIRLDGEHRLSRTLKTKAAKRDLPLTDDLIALLRPHLLRLGGGDTALLFPAKDGGPLNPSVITKHFARTCKRVGLIGFNFHDTRHSAITRWRTAKVDAETAAALAGHETPQITLGTYSSVDMARKRAAVERTG
jgi:integrase